ncbi:MAG: glycosyltransferase family 39 protein [Acidobacteriota bacterium]
MAAVWLASTIYLVPFVDRAWIPHDEGLLGQSAERVLGGQLPHRDYDEVYTGGLSYLHALAFKIGGVKSIALRWTVFGFVVAWVPVVFWIASRSVRPAAAALVTALAVTWSLPNYFSGMPSWYNLFFATFGVAALLRHLETGRARWLVAAGLAGGCSFLVKLAGLYYIAGAVVFLIANEVDPAGLGLSAAGRSDAADRRRAASLIAGKAVLAVCLAGSVAWLVRTHSNRVAILHFVVPVAAACAFLVWSEIAWGRRPVWPRLSRLCWLVLPFLAGVVLPIALFLVPYARSHALGDFYRGVFITPQQRLAAASAELPGWPTLLPLIPYALILMAGGLARRLRYLGLVVSVGFVVWLLFLLEGARRQEEYQMLWNMSRHLNTAAVVAGIVLLCRSGASMPAPRRGQLLLLATVMAFSSLIEFPFAVPIYFCYTAPLVALTVSAVVGSEPAAPRLPHVALAAVLTILAVRHINPGFIYGLGTQSDSYPTVPSKLQRLGLRIRNDERSQYQKLLGLILSHNTSRYVYAGPDCPEVYFLTGMINPTRTFYEAFDQQRMTPAAVLTLIEEHGITVVVINRTPEFSGPLSSEVDAALAARFPQSDEAGRFLVRWGL